MVRRLAGGALGALLAAGLMAPVAAGQTSTSADGATSVIGAPVGDVLDTKDLLALARRSQAAKVDQFSEDPAEALFGRPFEARPAGPVQVSYDLPSRTLSVSTTKWGDLAWVLAPPEYKTVGSYPGQNSYGAKADISVVQADEVRLAAQSVRENMDEVAQPNAVTFTTVLEPDAARALSGNLVWLVTGRLVKRSSHGQDRRGVVLVDEHVSSPTIASPAQVHFTTITLNAAVARIVLLDTASNKVLLTYEPPLS